MRSSRGICAGSEKCGTAVAVTTERSQIERRLALVCLSVNLRRAHLLVVRAPDEQRHTGQVTTLGGKVEA